MTQDEFDSLEGRVFALSTVLSTLIASLPPAIALETQRKLLVERIEQEMQDQEEPPAEAEQRGRHLILDNYIQLLEVVSKRA